MFEEWARVRPLALEHVNRPRADVGPTDGVRTPRRHCESKRLGRRFGCFCESAELCKTHHQPATVVDRWRSFNSERIGSPISRQCGEISGGQSHPPPVIAPEKMDLLQIG